jgi:tRNA modification GTPase
LALGGVPVLLTDTAGLRDATDEVEALGVARAERLIEAADILVWLGEPQDAPDHPRTLCAHSKSDLPGRRTAVPDASIPVSAVTGEGLAELMRRIQDRARTLLPTEDAIALNRRQAGHVGEVADALTRAADSTDPVLAAEELRVGRGAFDRLTGRAGVEDLLDALFSRFCLGK